MPISKAIECSTALPIVYKPVDLKGRQLVDGGIRSTTNVDIAVEKGRQVHRRRQPARPLRQRLRADDPDRFGTRVRRVADMGLPAIANQAFRLIAHARLHQAVEQWQEKYPGVDIILVEPEPNDELMFGTPIMDYSRRLQIARHGFESVTATLAQDYDRYKEIAERHGLEISERRVRRAVERAAEEEPEQTSAWRRVLEQTTAAAAARRSFLESRLVARSRALSARVELLDLALVLVGDDRPLDLQRRGQLAAFLGEVLGEDRDLLDLLDPGELLVDLREVGLDRRRGRRRWRRAAAGSSGRPCSLA